MGRRQRKRARKAGGPAGRAGTTDYVDAAGNVLSLRNAVSALPDPRFEDLRGGGAAATREDLEARRDEMLFERLTASWTIAELPELPMVRQKELLARYRLAGAEERAWVRRSIRDHLGRIES